jgi:hypothetical protein
MTTFGSQIMANIAHLVCCFGVLKFMIVAQFLVATVAVYFHGLWRVFYAANSGVKLRKPLEICDEAGIGNIGACEVAGGAVWGIWDPSKTSQLAAAEL